MSRIPGRAKIIAVVVTVALLPLAVMVLFAILTAREALTDQVLRAATLEGRGTAQVVAVDLQGKRRAVTLFASRRLLREAAARRDRAAVDRHLRDLISTIPDFERAVVTDPAGTLWAHYPATDESVVGRNFAHREWYRGVTQHKKTYLTGSYERAAEPVRLVYAFAAPLRDPQGRLAGYLVVQDSGEPLGERLGRLMSPAGGGTMVVDHNGRKVFASGHPAIPGEEDLRTASPCINAALRGDDSVERDTHAGKGYVVVCTPVFDTGWVTVTHFPFEVALAPVRIIAWQMTAGGLVLLAIGGLLAGYWANTYAHNRLLLAETGRLKHETELQRNRYWALLDASADGLAMADNSKTLLYVNRTFGRMFGFSDVENLIGRPVSAFRERLFPLLTDPHRYLEAVERLWRDPESLGDFEVTLKDGRVFHLYSCPVHGPGSETIGRSLVCRDVTRERELDRMKNEFVATVSHELRTPLASLLGFSELMLSRELPAEKRHQFTDVIHKEAKRLNALINDFLDLQRIESGRVTYAREQLNVASLIRETAALFSNDPKHPLRLEVPEGLPSAVGDGDRVRQVLHNLLSNAVKFSPKGGEIVAAARTTGDGLVEIAVTDVGLGIPAEAMPKLFGKFYRVDTTDRREIGGTGLGLALCKEIVTAHRGKIWAESKLGEGSTFRFTLPIKTAAIPDAEAAPAPAAVTATRAAESWVLIVEDDTSFAALVREHLAEAGLNARIEASAEGALALARQTPPALVILDIHLAGKMDGWDFLVEMKADPTLADIPVVITTVTEKRARGLALGASDYLVKPFPMERLVDAVRRYLPEPKGCRVLIVDDDASSRASVAERLRLDLRCETDEAEDGRVALEKIRRRLPDLVVLDLLMPVMDGFAVLDALRARTETAALPVLVVTGKSLTPQDKEHIKQGMARVLTKEEYSSEKLLALVRELVAKRYSG